MRSISGDSEGKARIAVTCWRRVKMGTRFWLQDLLRSGRLGQGSGSKSLCHLTQGEVCFGVLDFVLCVCPVAIPVTFPRFVLFVVFCWKMVEFWLSMGGDGYQTQRKSRGCWER